MYIKNRVASMIYKIAAAMVSLVGIMLTFGFPNIFNWGQLKFYTTLSNVLCFAFLTASAIYVVIQIKKSGLHGASTFMPHFKGAVVIAITVTLLVYQFMLSGAPFSLTNGGICSFIVHLLTPVLVILDWLIFDEKGHYNVFDPLRWMIIPLCYLVYAFIAAPLGITYSGSNRYPYYFLNIDTLGIGGVAMYVLSITGIFLILGYIVFGLDKWMGSRVKDT